MGSVARTHAQGRGRWQDEWTLDYTQQRSQECTDESPLPAWWRWVEGLWREFTVSGACKSSQSAWSVNYEFGSWIEPEAYGQHAWKVPPTAPPPTLQQSGGNSGFVDAREYHKEWQDRPYDPNDDPWIEDVDKDGKKSDKPVIQLFGNVDQKNADLAEAKAAAAAIAQIANRYCAPEDGISAGFPQFNAQVPLPPPAKADPPLLPASAIGSEKGFQEQKGKGKNYEKGGKPEFAKGGKPEFAKGGKDDKGGKNAAKGEFKGEFKGEKGDKGKQGSKGPTLPVPKASGHSSKFARIAEEPAEVVEANSNKMHDNGAMTDGSKRRHEAVESASDGESASSVIGSYSFISDTGDSPPLFPAVQSGLPATHKWDDKWEATVDYEEVDFNVPQPAWIRFQVIF